jgi:anti-sigma B factor antagonist
MSVKLSTRKSGSISIVDVSGNVTMGETASLIRETLNKMARAGQRKIVLNLAELSYLDSAGIGVLVSSFATINSLGGQLKLSNLTNRVKDLLLITKLYTVFEVFDNEQAAVSSFPKVAAGVPVTSE